ncbi:MAG: hypothetical protein K0S65_1615 [Labilithrix sp.]|nr:hypothetical protein [Labilithrix sp.]
MKTSLLSAIASAASLVAMACSMMGCATPQTLYERREKDDRNETNAADEEDSKAERPAGKDAKESTGPLGVVVIDVQRVFFDRASARNPQSNIAARMTRSQRVFELAGQKQVPLFITFEASKTGDHALPPSLAGALPAHAKQFVKTTFGAMGQPQFANAINTSGLERFLVIGAETDVCVLQTVLGMRRKGHEVIALVDALFTEEVNSGPALRRMRQAGVVELGMEAAEVVLESGGTTPTPAAPAMTSAPVIVSPLEIGILLHGLDGLNAADPNSAAKRVRLRELLLISEWFRIPLFAKSPDSALAALPSDLRNVLTRSIRPLADRPAQIKQLAIAGGHAGLEDLVAGLKPNADVFLVEDALFGGGSGALEPLYLGGAVPTTYKTLYYEMIQSVDEAQWPSKQWLTDFERYFDLTQAPEELPPLVPTL